MTIDFYYAPGSGPCRAVQLTASVIELDMNMKELDLLKQEHLTPEFIKINPQHTVPTLVDNGFALWESGVIATYLVQQYGKDESLYPKDLKQRALVDQRLYFNLGTLTARFGEYYYPVIFAGAEPDPVKFQNMEKAVKFLDEFLEGEQFLAGKCMTVADICTVATVATYEAAKFDISSYPNIARWYAKMKTLIPNHEEINSVTKIAQMYEKFMKK